MIKKHLQIKIILFYFIIFISQLKLQAQLCGTYTIDATNITGGTNFQTFTEAANELNTNGISCPVVFNVVSNIYYDNVILTNISGSSSTNTISFIGQGATNTILTFDGTGTEATWQMSGTSYITIKHLTIENTKSSSDAWGVHLSNAVENLIIDSCNVTMQIGNTSDIGAIVASNSLTSLSAQGNNANHISITNCNISGGYQGIRFNGINSTNGDIEDLYFANNFLRHQYISAIQILDVKNLVIASNDIDSIITGGNDYGITLNRVNDYKINGNIIRRTEGTGFRLNNGNKNYTTTSNSEITNNIIINTGGVCLNPVAYENTNIYNNTLYSTATCILSNTHTNVDIRNNIFHSSSTGNIFRSQVALTANDILDNNIYYGPFSTLPYRVVNNQYADFATWKSAMPLYNNNSINAQPSFADVVSSVFDLHMVNDFNAYNMGANVNITIDIDGDPRPQDGGFDIGADEFSLNLLPVDLAIINITEPNTPFCGGMNNIKVVLQNQGTNTIDSVNLVLTLPGATNTTFNFGGLNIASLQNDTIDLGIFPFTAGIPNDIQIFSFNPNGIVDANNTNDTLISTVTPSLSGTYTIDSSQPTAGTNYQSFTDATFALSTFGICGPTVFDIAPGTYSEKVYLGTIIGSSPTNTLTFNGEEATNTILTYNGASTQATFQMEGTSYIFIKNLTIETTKTTSNAWGLHLSKGVNHCTVDSCRFILPLTHITEITGIVASNSLTSDVSEAINVDNLIITNSYFRGGEAGIHIEGNNSTYSSGFNISNNVFLQHDDHAFECDNIEDIILSHNNVDSVYSLLSDGFYLADVNNYQINSNYINVADWGVFIYNGNQPSYYTTVNSLISNNMVITSEDDGIYLYNFKNTNVYNNTIKSMGAPALRIDGQVNVNLRNNILDGGTNYALLAVDALTSTDTLDYNIYSSTSDICFENGIIYTDLTNWQVASPNHNTNSIEDLPLFISPTDLHMNNDLNAYNNGVDVGIIEDIDEESRPQNGGYDIGADEFRLTFKNVTITELVTPNNNTCENNTSYFEFIISNTSGSTEDTIPYVFSLVGNSSILAIDTSFSPIQAGGVDTIIVGPYNTVGFGNSLLTIYTNMNGDTNPNDDTLTTTIVFNNSITVELNADTTICDGSSFTVTPLDLGYTYNSYLWQDGSVGDSYLATTIETITLEVTDTNGCVSTDMLNIDVQICSDIETIETIKFKTYPNPVYDILTIELEKPFTNVIIEIISSVGHVIETYDISNDKKVQVNLGYLVNGIYTVRVITDSGVNSKQFIKLNTVK